MKIICNKEEFAQILGHCVNNKNGNDFNACNKCALFEICNEEYIEKLIKLVEVKESETP